MDGRCGNCPRPWQEHQGCNTPPRRRSFGCADTHPSLCACAGSFRGGVARQQPQRLRRTQRCDGGQHQPVERGRVVAQPVPELQRQCERSDPQQHDQCTDCLPVAAGGPGHSQFQPGQHGACDPERSGVKQPQPVGGFYRSAGRQSRRGACQPLRHHLLGLWFYQYRPRDTEHRQPLPGLERRLGRLQRGPG